MFQFNADFFFCMYVFTHLSKFAIYLFNWLHIYKL